jgi:hypothetical protein
LAAERSREQRIEARLHALREEFDQRLQVLETHESEAALLDPQSPTGC